jgi:hypothetical protein
MMNLLIAVAAVAAAFFGARFLYQQDTAVEDRRRAALKMASALKSKGLTRVSDFFEDYAVGDYSGMLKKLKDAAVVLSHDAALQDEFEGVFDKLLAEALTDAATAKDIANQAVTAVAATQPSLLAEIAATVNKLAPVAASVAAVVAPVA